MRNSPELTRVLRTVALASSLALIAAMTIDCGSGASCDAVCDNVLDKCDEGGLLGSSDKSVLRNNCVESCAQLVQAVPDSCAEQRDNVLSCLSDAPSIDCNNPQGSAACTSQNNMLSACESKSSGSGQTSTGAVNSVTSATSSGTAGGGAACQQDNGCQSGICNTKLNQCSTPGPIDGPCYRDSECQTALCNTKLDQCENAGALGGGCYRDEECANGLCNTKLDQCATAGALGAGCYRDQECANGLCNTKLDQCATAGAAGSPCYRAEECASGNCNGQSCN